jgi:protein LTV1
MLRLRDVRGPKPAKITIDPKTGFPLVDGKSVLEPRGGDDTIMEEEDEEEEEEEEFGESRPDMTLVPLDGTDSVLLLCAIAAVIREVIKRPRTETAEEKKARKAAVKAERAVRREEKKGTKEAFNSETKRQKRVQGRRVADGGAADIKSGMEGVRRLA